MKSIRKMGKKKITLDEISKLYKLNDYNSLIHFIIDKIDTGFIEPIRNSGTNGKTPALYNRYRIIHLETDNSEYENELQFNLHSSLKIDYYLKNINKYKEDRQYILQLSNYISNHKELLNQPVSMNERSFEIWNREKYLQKEGGFRILKNLGFSLQDLNIYETTEPLSYYSHHKDIPQNVLILENKDTFYSMRRHLIKGNENILGLPIGTLIYGKGKGIIKSFKDFTFCVEPYLSDESNQIIYLGDLDYEGILIYEQLSAVFMDRIPIKPFNEAYLYMLKKAKEVILPETKEGQNKNIGNYFLDSFNDNDRSEILEILRNNKYIPQEILSSRDF
ncbi:MAG: Wadjet anti-phage system protein JetD domain-containing protein [Spirochaetota bacterium]